jgi:hypothetical protein
MKPARSNITIIKQICEMIPGHLVTKLAKEYGVDKQSRKITPWSHVVALLYAQLSHALGLNDVCDALRNQADSLKTIRGAVAPSRNGLSHANCIRDAAMAEALYWEVFHHITNTNPRFIKGSGKYMPRRFKKVINVLDATVIKLVANCIDWAKHRRRKAAAKLHMRLDLQSFLPRYARVKPGSCHEVRLAREVCAGIRAGEIVLFDMAYNDFMFLAELTHRGVFWVGRAKENLKYRILEQRPLPLNGAIIRDEEIELTIPATHDDYPMRLRLVEADVEVDKKIVRLTFLSNNLEWAASSICDLYRCRWAIEVFFKEIKGTLQLCDFLGNNANAVTWQVWIGLLAHLLMRYLAWLSQWEHSFTRIFTTIRALLWNRFDLMFLLKSYGTAGSMTRARAAPEQAYIPGLTY